MSRGRRQKRELDHRPCDAEHRLPVLDADALSEREDGAPNRSSSRSDEERRRLGEPSITSSILEPIVCRGYARSPGLHRVSFVRASGRSPGDVARLMRPGRKGHDADRASRHGCGSGELPLLPELRQGPWRADVPQDFDDALGGRQAADRQSGVLARIEDRCRPDRKRGRACSLLDLDDPLAVVPGELTTSVVRDEVLSGREVRPGPDLSIVIDRVRVVGEEPGNRSLGAIRPSSTSRIRSHRAQAARFPRAA